MPRSSRGATGHRGHRNRKRSSTRAQPTAAAQAVAPATVAAPAEVEAPAVEATPATTASAAPAAPPRRAPAPQPLGTTVSGASVQGDPLLKKELIRITALAGFIAVLLVLLTTVLRDYAHPPLPETSTVSHSRARGSHGVK